MASWARDEGYSGCKAARFGSIAVVICPPEYGNGWGYQAFDEDDEEAMAYGETVAQDYGFHSEEAVIRYVEGILEEGSTGYPGELGFWYWDR